MYVLLGRIKQIFCVWVTTPFLIIPVWKTLSCLIFLCLCKHIPNTDSLVMRGENYHKISPPSPSFCLIIILSFKKKKLHYLVLCIFNKSIYSVVHVLPIIFACHTCLLCEKMHFKRNLIQSCRKRNPLNLSFHEFAGAILEEKCRPTSFIYHEPPKVLGIRSCCKTNTINKKHLTRMC